MGPRDARLVWRDEEQASATAICGGRHLRKRLQYRKSVREARRIQQLRALRPCVSSCRGALEREAAQHCGKHGYDYHSLPDYFQFSTRRSSTPVHSMSTTTTTTVIVRCDYVRTARFLGLFAADSSFTATGSACAIAGQRSGTKRGWCSAITHTLTTVDAARKMRDNHSFNRCFMAIYATDRNASSVADLAAAAWAAAAAAAAAGGGGVRVHVFDGDSEESTFQTELIAALGAVGATLSPTEYESVVVAVRMGGTLTWGLLDRLQFAQMRPTGTSEASETTTATTVTTTQTAAATTTAPKTTATTPPPTRKTAAPPQSKQHPPKKVVCRAAYKLLDALQLLAARNIAVDTALPALDVGASPGGWTEALLVRCSYSTIYIKYQVRVHVPSLPKTRFSLALSRSLTRALYREMHGTTFTHIHTRTRTRTRTM